MTAPSDPAIEAPAHIGLRNGVSAQLDALADGRMDGSQLLVSSKEVAEPIAVRYAYTQQPLGHLLCNKDGMPVGPFSTIGYGPEMKTDAAGKSGKN